MFFGYLVSADQYATYSIYFAASLVLIHGRFLPDIALYAKLVNVVNMWSDLIHTMTMNLVG